MYIDMYVYDIGIYRVQSPLPILETEDVILLKTLKNNTNWKKKISSAIKIQTNKKVDKS